MSKKYQVALASTLNNDGSLGSEKYDAVSPGFDRLVGDRCVDLRGDKIESGHSSS